MSLTYFIQTFGCAQNEADSERIASMLKFRGMKPAKKIEDADHIVINTCMIREMAENRVYGRVNNINKLKAQNSKFKSKVKSFKTKGPKIVVTGCMVGMAVRDKSGKFLKLIKSRLPGVDEFLPIEEVGFDHAPLRTDAVNAWVPISNGCNNFCTFCVVPFTRGREISRPYEDVIKECISLAAKGYKKITLLGMNVNSYGADLVVGADNVQVMRDIDKKYFSPGSHPEQSEGSSVRSERKKNALLDSSASPQNDSKMNGYKLPDGRIVKPILVKHLNRLRIPTLFPYLLDDICKIDGIETVDFMSSNPWDFSDELIEVISRNPKVTRYLHFAVQSGSDTVLKRMNRWYTRDEYLSLVANLKLKISNLKLSTDIIVGFCGETEEEFLDTVDLAKRVGFYKAYISMYSDRPMTAAHKAFKDDVPHPIKKRRWQVLEDLINKPKRNMSSRPIPR